MRIALKLVISCIFVFCSCACSFNWRTGGKSPQFYPNAKYQQVGELGAENDATGCMELADEYVKERDKYKEVAAGTAEAGVIGAAAGAVSGAIFSQAGRGTAAGAASGAIVGLLRGLLKLGEGDPNYQLFVSHCLRQKGYEVYAWE